MSARIPLGDLEFKADDFRLADVMQATPAAIAALVNDRLRERLEKLQQIYTCKGYGHYDKWTADITDLDAHPSHTARLICVEEIKGQE